jgi:putative membrane protein
MKNLQSEATSECNGRWLPFLAAFAAKALETTMKRILVATTCVLLTLPALAETTSEKLGVNSALDIAPTTADFIGEAVAGNLFEIRSSRLAQQQGDAASKSFADRMITDHEKLGADLKDLIQSKKIDVTVPAAPTEKQQAELSKLDKLKSADFDKQYRDDQYAAHKDTVSLFQRYAKSGDNADLKQWAQQVEPMLEHHLQMARELDKQASR